MSRGLHGVPSRTRTYDRLLRRQMLYPTELWAHRQAVQAFKNIRAYPVQSQRDSRLGRGPTTVLGRSQHPHDVFSHDLGRVRLGIAVVDQRRGVLLPLRHILRMRGKADMVDSHRVDYMVNGG